MPQTKLGFWRLLTGELRRSPFEDPAEELRKDILRNLANVLNARRGRVVGCPELGLDDVEDLARAPARIAQVIKQQIVRFEPRLDPEKLQVTFSREESPADSVDGTFRAHFLVSARMLLPTGPVPIRIQTTVLSEASQVEVPAQEGDSAVARPRRVLVEPEKT